MAPSSRPSSQPTTRPTSPQENIKAQSKQKRLDMLRTVIQENNRPSHYNFNELTNNFNIYKPHSAAREHAQKILKLRQPTPEKFTQQSILYIERKLDPLLESIESTKSPILKIHQIYEKKLFQLISIPTYYRHYVPLKQSITPTQRRIDRLKNKIKGYSKYPASVRELATQAFTAKLQTLEAKKQKLLTAIQKYKKFADTEQEVKKHIQKIPLSLINKTHKIWRKVSRDLEAIIILAKAQKLSPEQKNQFFKKATEIGIKMVKQFPTAYAFQMMNAYNNPGRSKLPDDYRVRNIVEPFRHLAHLVEIDPQIAFQSFKKAGLVDHIAKILQKMNSLRKKRNSLKDRIQKTSGLSIQDTMKNDPLLSYDFQKALNPYIALYNPGFNRLFSPLVALSRATSPKLKSQIIQHFRDKDIIPSFWKRVTTLALLSSQKNQMPDDIRHDPAHSGELAVQAAFLEIIQNLGKPIKPDLIKSKAPQFLQKHPDINTWEQKFNFSDNVLAKIKKAILRITK